MQKELSSLNTLDKAKIEALKKRKLVAPTSLTAFKVGFQAETKHVPRFQQPSPKYVQQYPNRSNWVLQFEIFFHPTMGSGHLTELSFQVEKTEKFSSGDQKAVADLTAEMISKGTWSSTTFKPLNLTNASGVPSVGGHLHPLNKAS